MTQGKPKTPHHPSGLRPAQLRQLFSLLALLQYRYQSNAEDQRLTTQLFKWLLEASFLSTSVHHLLTVPVLLGHMSESIPLLLA